MNSDNEIFSRDSKNKDNTSRKRSPIGGSRLPGDSDEVFFKKSQINSYLKNKELNNIIFINTIDGVDYKTYINSFLLDRVTFHTIKIENLELPYETFFCYRPHNLCIINIQKNKKIADFPDYIWKIFNEIEVIVGGKREQNAILNSISNNADRIILLNYYNDTNLLDIKYDSIIGEENIKGFSFLKKIGYLNENVYIDDNGMENEQGYGPIGNIYVNVKPEEKDLLLTTSLEYYMGY